MCAEPKLVNEPVAQRVTDGPGKESTIRDQIVLRTVQELSMSCHKQRLVCFGYFPSIRTSGDHLATVLHQIDGV